MIWMIEKTVVRHLVEGQGQLAEVPVRVEFEYAIEDGSVVDGSLTLNPLYNKAAVRRHFPELDADKLDDAVQCTVERAIDEHLAHCGFQRTAPAANDDGARTADGAGGERQRR